MLFETTRAARLLSAIAVFCAALTPVTTIAAEDSKSSAVAKELAQALDAAKLDSIAAVDPADPTAFVAALYFPGAQLLVVSAKYSAPPLLVTKIGTKEYRDVYIDLQSASIAGSKVFVQDMMADGLSPRAPGDRPADTWEHGSKTVAFDGEWKKAKLSEAEYMKTFGEADERYAAMLSVLLGKARQRSGS